MKAGVKPKTNTSSFRELRIRDSINTSDHNFVEDFFAPLLSSSVQYDRGVGYFSSGWLRENTKGMTRFAEQQGLARWVTSPILNEGDWEAFLEGHEARQEDSLKQILRDNIQSLEHSLEHETLSALAWMIADGIIEVKLAVPRNKLSGGEFHDKFGVFMDRDGDKVSFNGSYNDSVQGLRNYESLRVYRSWDNSQSDWVREDDLRFQKLWNNEDRNVRVYEIDQANKERILKLRATVRPYHHPDNYSKNSERAIGRFRPPESIQIRDYQNEAYERWVNNGSKGILAMATGTGKTITALNCVWRESQKDADIATPSVHLLILVPTEPLLNQWIEELRSWNLTDVVQVGAGSNWRKSLREIVNDIQFGVKEEFAVVSTYKSFTNSTFQKLLKQLPEDTLLIADEAHSLGQPQVQKVLSTYPFEKRIGLSATPQRIYDPEGSEIVDSFFNDHEPYCYGLSMEQAIAAGYLCRYKYYPHLVELNQEELNTYIRITKQLVRVGSKLEHPAATGNDLFKALLLKRKRIINKAKGKLLALREIIQDITLNEELEYCFTYAPAGELTEAMGDDDNIRMIRQMQRIFQKECPDIKTHTYLGETEKREEILKAFEKGDIDVLLAINCLDEGVDIPRAGIGIFTASTGNPRQYIQRRGRVLRNHPHKDLALIYDMIVIPKILRDNGSANEIFALERALVQNELRRVVYFASLSENFYETKNQLREVCDYYQLEIDTIIKDLQI